MYNNPYTANTSATSGLNGYKPSTVPSYGTGTTPYSYSGATSIPNPYSTATTSYPTSSGYPTTNTGAGSFSNLGVTSNTNLPAPTNSSKMNLAGQAISSVNIDDEEAGGNFHTIIEKRQRESEKVPFEGEPYDCLKHLTQQQIDEYAQRGIGDYLNCLRLSTKQELVSKYHRTLETCKVQANGDRNYSFVDEEFPPNLSSLVGANQANRTSWKALKWYRPKDMQGYSTFQLFVGNIEPNDIRQGYLGDCYFLSSIASLAENPDRIKALFSKDIEDRERNPHGCHCVRICDKGEWKEVIVDEHFPCISKQRGPSFTKGNGAEVWVMLLEKAWAKINGSYDQIEAGLTRECLHDFTGAPTQTYWLDEPTQYKEVWEKLLLGEANNYAMTCGSTDVETKDELDKVGLISGHAYSLLSAYEVSFQGQPVKLVKLRNPWGEKEWSGDWCDDHPNFKFLSAQDKQKIELHDRAENDGIFFMTYDDFRKYFTDVQICFVHDKYQYFSIRAQSNSKQGKFFKVKITKEGRYFFTINQKSKRKYPKEQQKDFKYSTATLIIAKQEPNGNFTYIDGKQREDREVWTGENQRVYKPGTYIVYAKVQWRGKEQDEFVLSSYGEGLPAFTEITKVEAQNIISEAFFSHAVQQQAEDQRLNRQSKRKILSDNKSWVHLNQTEDGFFYLAVENKSDKVLNGEFKFTKMGGLKLKHPFTGQSVKISLEPGQHSCALLRVKDYKTLSGLSLSQTIHFK